MKTAFRNWKPYILNHFDDERVTNAFTESFKVKKKRFEEVGMARMTYFMMSDMLDDEYETKTKTRQGNLGTDLPTLLALLDTDTF